MARTTKLTLAPAVVALAALFMVLPQGGADAEVTMRGAAGEWAFDPSTIQIQPGARVAFVNETEATHTARCDGCPWDTGDIQPGETVMVTFDDETSSRFSCRYHGASLGMTGQVLVGTAPVPSPEPSPS